MKAGNTYRFKVKFYIRIFTQLTRSNLSNRHIIHNIGMRRSFSGI